MDNLPNPHTVEPENGVPTPKSDRPFPNARQRLEELQEHLLELPQVELPLEHLYAEGVYMRVLHIPADTVLTGHIHKYECINVIPVGEIEVATEEGKKRIIGPAWFPSPAGVKRAGYTLRDTIWITVHANPTDERDDDSMVDRLTVPSFKEYERFLELEQHRKALPEE